ncbi:uncharacterized protein LOC115446696 [Manduca sexta]|uniref:uncharacterized protein LOC115446696 n=1 Tax=Manduca sexta TaxID=7130 RepID=UPI0018908A10|nr:uncharacterized protein LOC115446696 [Manduca sexta]
MKFLTKILTVLAAVAISSSSVVRSSDGNFELLILHNNDMHARFEQTSQHSGSCTKADREAKKCYGGFARVAHVVKEARAAAKSGAGPPVLYLNAGDTYTGTAWFTIYKWRIAAEFINALQPDAVSLGNQDLQIGSDDVPQYLNDIQSKILASNVILKNQNVDKSIIMDINGVKVGIVGYLTPDASMLDSSGDIEYIDEVLALKEEVSNLQKFDVNIIIALGHSTLNKAKEIAADVDGIDLIINGYKNKFSWNRNDIETDLQKEITVTQPSGKQVPIVPSTAYSKYLGKILIKFDTAGEIVDHDANAILLDSAIPEDNEAVQIKTRYFAEMLTRSNEVIGNTAVVLDGETCKTEECNLGNLIADSMMYYNALRFVGEDPWTDAPIAIIHGGAIKASIAPTNRPAAVTRGNLLTALPLESNVVAITVNGTILNQVLEHSVSDYNLENSSGRFLQFSGIRVEYDLSRDPGSRVVNAVVRCGRCTVPQFFVIDDWRSYKILMPVAIANGEFGYTMFGGLPRENNDYDEVTCTAEFIRLRSPVYPEIASRIILNNIPSLGNHELDNGVSGLTPFIKNVTCPVLAANLDLSKEADLAAESNLMNSVIFDINGTKIGIIGYLTPDTKVLAIRNNVEYIEEVKAIREEVKNLKKEGVKIFIALGHSGFTKDLQIAKEVEDIDLVIGGHTNTFLWNGQVPDIEEPQGPYPTLVKQASGRVVPAVQAYAYTKYLGKLQITFNADGEITKFDGNPILLNHLIPEDPDVLEIVNRYRGDVMKISEVVIGNTSVILDARMCRLQECNIGNLICDAMIYKYVTLYKGEGWTDAPIAIIQGGGIRASVAHLNMPCNVTKGELITVMPFDGSMAKVTINGSGILTMLEHAVASYNTIRAPGQFLQISGLKVVYDFKMPSGKRVQDVYVRCGMCEIPSFAPLNKTQKYNILMPSFISLGGDGFYSLGNHEFDNGVSGLTPFIENLTCPIVAANLILDKVPELAQTEKLKKSVVLNVNDKKIGIVGYLTPDTKVLAVKNDVEYIEEVEALNIEVKRLQSQGIKIIIALGHSGYLKDLEIAKKVEGVDLVIGGHTNTFLWNGTSPDSEHSQGPYPTYVTQASGRSVPVVQAYAYTKYLGRLHMIFDEDGEIASLDGEPILLNQDIPQDPNVLHIIEKYRAGILNSTEEILGNTSVILDGQSCMIKECNLGNMITDAMVFQYATNYRGEHWTDAPIAIMQGGGIRSSVAHAIMPSNITKGDLLAIMPFDGSLVTVTMNGSVLLQMLEHSSLGNHEFDEAIEGLIPFIRNVTTPVLAANLILNKVPELQNESNLHRSIIIIKNGVKIGIIGYLTPQTKYLVFKNDVEYEDEVIALKREVKQLKHKGVNILIALGHSGFEEDLIIAKEVEDIDLVIGGHSNTFLWNDIVTDEITEPISGPYPTVVRQASGRLVRVVQAYAYTKYLGKLHLIFDSDGEIIECDGTPLLLDQEVPRDPELMKIVNKYRVEVERISNEVVGSSQVFLDGKTCRLQECNLGDLITTAMLNYTQENHLSNVNIAIIAGGRIRSSISHPQTPFSLTRGEWMTVLPFSDVLTIVTMNGSTLREGLEHSVSEWNPVDSKGQFLQFSGIEVVYDLEKPPGSRVVKAKAVCSNCGQFKPVDVKDYYEYEVLMPSFLAQRGDGFTMFDGLPDWPLTYNELECVLYYVNKYSPINQTRNGRITLLNEDKARKRFSYDARNAPSSSIRVFNTKAKYVVWVAALLLIRNI